MPTLVETQSIFRDAVVRTRGGHRGSETFAGGGNQWRGALAPSTEFHTSLIDALLVKFPATAWLVGTPFLTDAAKHFVIEASAPGAMYRGIRRSFPDFLSQCSAAEGLPYICDFAELEWYLGKVAIAVDKPAVSGQEVSAIDPDALPDILLALQPGLHYLNASWPVDELMKLYLTETAPDRLEFAPAEVWIEVRGARGEFHFSRLDAAEYMFRKSVLEGHSIGECGRLRSRSRRRFRSGRSSGERRLPAGLITTIKQNA